MCLPMHQRTDAVGLFKSWRYGSSNLSDVCVSEHGSHSSPNSTPSTSTARDEWAKIDEKKKAPPAEAGRSCMDRP